MTVIGVTNNTGFIDLRDPEPVNNTFRQSLSYVSARCAEGKTLYAIAHLVVAAIRGKTWILAQPTIELIEQTLKTQVGLLAKLTGDQSLKRLCQEYGPEVTVGCLDFVRCFHSQQQQEQDSIIKKTISLLDNPPHDGCVLLVTQSTLFSLPRGFRDWNVMIDEAPQVFNFHSFYIEKTGDFILDHLLIREEPSVPDYLLIKPKNRKSREVLASLYAGDSALRTYQQLLRDILSRSHRCYIRKDIWQRKISGELIQLQVHSILTPKLLKDFCSVTVMSARFEETLLHKLWSGRHFRVLFRDNSPISNFLSGNPKHPSEETVSILYALPGAGYSKDMYNKRKSGDKPLISALIDAAAAFLEGRPCLYTANNSIRDKQLGQFGKGSKRVSSLSHGIDSFKDLHNYVFLSALNPRPESYTFLTNYGISGEQIRIAITNHAAYQGACRTSLRLGAKGGPNILIVPTEGLATWLADCFEKSVVQKLPFDFSPFFTKRQTMRPMTSTERSRTHYIKQKLKSVLSLNGITNHTDLVGELISIQDLDLFAKETKTINESSIAKREIVGRSITEIAQKFKCETFTHPAFFESCSLLNADISAQFLPTLRSKPDSSLQFRGTFDELETFFSHLMKRAIPDRDQAGVFSAATFGSKTGPDGRLERTCDNLAYALLLVLDIDDGDLTPELLRSLFPHTDIITYGTTSAGRFRAVFRLSLKVDGPTYKKIREAIINKISAVCPRHGIKDCSNAVSLFRLPVGSSNTSYPVERQYGGPLDVLQILKNLYGETIDICIQEHDFTSKGPLQVLLPKASLEGYRRRAQEKFESVKDGNGRHRAFYNYARRLAHLYGEESPVRQGLNDTRYKHPEKQRKIEETILKLRRDRLI